MLVRLLALLFAVSFTALAGQGGPVSNGPKAGDLAPDLAYTKLLSSPGEASWRPSNFFGKITVLVIDYPSPEFTYSPVPQAMKDWNALVDQFAGKPVQFVWIACCGASDVPWLAKHPLKGFVLFGGGRSYGMELTTASVIIGADGRIIGFDPTQSELVPSANTVNAALEGRITTIKPGPAELQAFIDGHKVLLEAQAPPCGGCGPRRPDGGLFVPPPDSCVRPDEVLCPSDLGTGPRP